MTLTRQKLTGHLYETIGLSKPEARALVDAFFEEIRDALTRGDEVKLSSFGKFILRDKNPRPGFNPKTGEPHTVTARRVVTFHAGTMLRARCNPGQE